ncbi:MAG: hypothetical protein R3300_20820 [Candidatus Promineifilaceae bacterium]|nr:hypothetical protein [Candidatus Promineifilaceae bacterium]
MELLEKCIALALEAHEGQVDKQGRPYILHPLYLMGQMDSPLEMMVAVLHDVVEDTALTLDDLAAIGVPGEALEALALLTHDRDEQDYLSYVQALKNSRLAKKVKLADLAHNMDLRRIDNPTERDFARLRRYRQAWAMLTS